MLFSKLFRKDYRYFMEQGEKQLVEERFSDARHAFQDALQKVRPDTESCISIREYLAGRVSFTGNRLGQLNLIEAEQALKREDFGKAAEHLVLIEELAEDATIREMAQLLRDTLMNRDGETPYSSEANDCSGCSNHVNSSQELSHIPENNLSVADKFDLLINTLPGDLPRNYANLGEKFAVACILSQEGVNDESLKLFDELLSDLECDILYYEKAIIYHRMGNLDECERLLHRSFKINPSNPLSNLAFVQLFIDTDRPAEALKVLDSMISSNLLTEQALLLKGDVYQSMGEIPHAIEQYTQVLSYPKAAKGAAERLIGILHEQGRDADVELLSKRYLKGCC